jgi:uncharacterized protein (DUF362 family)
MKKLLLLSALVVAATIITCTTSNNPRAEKSAGTGDSGKAVDDGRTPSVVSLVQSSAVTQASDFTYPEILALTREAITLAGGLNDIIKRGDTVVLKPNVITTVWNWGVGGSSVPELVNGVCTDRRVIQAVAEIVREIVGPAGKILVIEGSGKGSTEAHFENLGYTKANLVNVDEIIALENEGAWAGAGNASGSTDYVTQVTLENFAYNRASGTGAYLRYYKNDGKYYVNKKMYEADALISIPVVKNHWNAVVTGAIKNISIGGAPPRIYGNAGNDIGRNNMVNHASVNLHDWIADYFSCVPADFVVMDGLQGLQNGPLPNANNSASLAAHQKNLRCILASKDALAIDVVEANITGWDYSTVPYLVKLNEKGQVGGKPNGRVIQLRGNPKDIIVLGNKTVDDVRGSYAGSMGAGNTGSRISQADQAKPTVTINSAVFSGSTLTMEMELSNERHNNVVKVDIYIDGAYRASFNTGMSNISLEVPNVAAGSRVVEVRAFTKFMYSTTAHTLANR